MTELATALLLDPRAGVTEAPGTWIIDVVAVNKTGKVYEKNRQPCCAGPGGGVGGRGRRPSRVRSGRHCHISLDPFPEQSEKAPDQVPDQSEVGFVKEGQEQTHHDTRGHLGEGRGPGLQVVGGAARQ
jgi:hypothetical protein